MVSIINNSVRMSVKIFTLLYLVVSFFIKRMPCAKPLALFNLSCNSCPPCEVSFGSLFKFHT